MSSSSSHSPSPPHVVEDMPHVLQLLSDGTVVRCADYNTLPTPSVPPAALAVQWKDVVYDAAHGLKLRVYRPPAASSSNNNNKKKLPVLVYFHGGGFVLGTFALPNFHACCLRLAGELPAVVLSADYRLAPEHRLPAALDDAAAVMSWVRAQQGQGGDPDPWLAESAADLGRVFVAGDSAGGNIVHHVAVRLASASASDPAVRGVAGHVMLCPFFGGAERTASEAPELPPGPFLTLPWNDQAWRLALPAGATRDHPFANPFGPESLGQLGGGVVLPRTLVVAAERDLLRDRQAEYVARLRAMGQAVEHVVFEGQHHGFYAVEPAGDAASEVVRLVKRFVYGDGDGCSCSNSN